MVDPKKQAEDLDTQDEEYRGFRDNDSSEGDGVLPDPESMGDNEANQEETWLADDDLRYK